MVWSIIPATVGTDCAIEMLLTVETLLIIDGAIAWTVCKCLFSKSRCKLKVN